MEEKEGKILRIWAAFEARLNKKIDQTLLEKIVRHLMSLNGFEFWLIKGGDHEVDESKKKFRGKYGETERAVAAFLEYFSVEDYSMSFESLTYAARRSLEIDFDRKELSFSFSAKEPSQEDFDLIKETLWGLIELLKEEVIFYNRPGINVTIRNYEYTKRRPRHRGREFIYDKVVNLYDIKATKESILANDGDWRDLYQEAVKAAKQSEDFAVEQRDEGRFSMITWCDKIDLEYIGSRLEKKEAFLAEYFPELPIHPDFNALGDLEVYTSQRNMGGFPDLSEDEDPFFSEYGRQYAIAIKMYMPPSPTKIDAVTRKILQDYAEKRTLADQRPIKQIALVLPNRELVLSLKEDAKACGVDKIWYVDDYGNYWDTEPDGKWKKVV